MPVSQVPSESFDTIDATQVCQTKWDILADRWMVRILFRFAGIIGGCGDYWWVRVLPPRGTLIWRLPRLVRPIFNSSRSSSKADPA